MRGRAARRAVAGTAVTMALVIAAAVAAPPLLSAGHASPQRPPAEPAVPSLHASAAAEAAAASLPGVPRRPASPAAWVAPGTGLHLLDDFESAMWPDAARWPRVIDLSGATDGEYAWGTSSCRAADGARSLRAAGGGADGAGRACDATYPAGQQSAALLALDLGALHSAARADLMLDVWSDAGPNEGLVVSYITFEADGSSGRRRVVFSATGRPRDWSRGVRIDLANLRDRLDPAWQLDLRGRSGYLELLFVSLDRPSGEGIFVDNLRLDAPERPPVVVTSEVPTPPPGDRTVACAKEPDCKTVFVRVFDDYRCDAAYRAGLDVPARGAAVVDVTAGAERLRATVRGADPVYLRVPVGSGATVQVTAPAGYAPCPNQPDVRRIDTSSFGRSDFLRLTFGLYRRP